MLFHRFDLLYHIYNVMSRGGMDGPRSEATAFACTSEFPTALRWQCQIYSSPSAMLPSSAPGFYLAPHLPRDTWVSWSWSKIQQLSLGHAATQPAKGMPQPTGYAMPWVLRPPQSFRMIATCYQTSVISWVRPTQPGIQASLKGF